MKKTQKNKLRKKCNHRFHINIDSWDETIHNKDADVDEVGEYTQHNVTIYKTCIKCGKTIIENH